MKVRFERGKRYRVRVQLPKAVSPRLAVDILRKMIGGVVIVSADRRGLVVVEATWRERDRVVDSDILLDASPLDETKA